MGGTVVYQGVFREQMLLALLLVCLAGLASAERCVLAELSSSLSSRNLQSFFDYLASCELRYPEAGNIIEVICKEAHPYEAFVAVLNNLGNRQQSVNYAVNRATFYNRVDLINKLAQDGHHILGSGNCVLRQAASCDHMDLAVFYVDSDADINVFNLKKDNNFNLYCTIMKSYNRMLYFLVNKGVDIYGSLKLDEIVYHLGMSGCEEVLSLEECEFASFLLQRMGREDELARMLIFAIKSRKRPLVKRLQVECPQVFVHLNESKYIARVLLDRHEQEIFDSLGVVSFGVNYCARLMRRAVCSTEQEFSQEFSALVEEAHANRASLEPLTEQEMREIFWSSPELLIQMTVWVLERTFYPEQDY